MVNLLSLFPPELKHVDILRVQDGDVLMVRIDRAISTTERQRFSDILKSVFPNNKVLIIDGGDVSISMIRPETLQE